MEIRRYCEGKDKESMYTFYEILTDEDSLVAKGLFEAQKERKMHAGDFEDKVWRMSNGFDVTTIDFSETRFAPPNWRIERYVDLLKRYCVAKVDTKSVVTVASWIRNIIRLGNQSAGWTERISDCIPEREREIVIDFLELLGIDAMDCLTGYSGDVLGTDYNTRSLAPDFWTYYVWDYELKKFWNQASLENKLIYAPLYFFWRLCVVLPSRPKGFCLMPRDCVELDEEGYYSIRVRQSHIKGKEKKVTNVIQQDYPIRTYRIDKNLANELLWYRDCQRESYCETENDYFFNNIVFNNITGRKMGKVFKNKHLVMLRDMFCFDVLVNKGYVIKEYHEIGIISHGKEKWLTKWRLGDLRHLAMVDMIVRGISPAVIMELAGQESLASACHYYSNSANMGRSRLAFLDWISAGSQVQLKSNFFSPIVTSSYRKAMYGGDCTNEKAEEKKLFDCAVFDTCVDGCPYFLPNEEGKKLFEMKKDSDIQKRISEFIYWFEKGKKERATVALRDAQDEIIKTIGGSAWQEERSLLRKNLEG